MLLSAYDQRTLLSLDCGLRTKICETVLCNKAVEGGFKQCDWEGIIFFTQEAGASIYILHNYRIRNRAKEFCCGSSVKVITCETGFLDCNPDLSSTSNLVASKIFLNPNPTSFKGSLCWCNSIDSNGVTFTLRQWKWNWDIVTVSINSSTK